MHEAALKAQAKKMNVESLRTGDQSGESAEVVSLCLVLCQSIMYMKYLFSKLEETNLRFTKKATFYLFKAEAYICISFQHGR